MADTVPARGNILGKFIPARYVLAILGSIGMAIIYGLKVNLSVAIIPMINNTAVQLLLSESAEEHHIDNTLLKNENGIVAVLTTLKNSTGNLLTNLQSDTATGVCEGSGEQKQIGDGPFAWDPTLKGYILSSYFCGYLVSQLPGARVAELFSAKWVMFFSVAINVICTLLTPPAAYASWIGMLVMRIGEGIGGGVTFPAMHVMLASWAPPNERSVMSAIVYAGTALGTVISMFLAGVIGDSLGWEAVFYIMGGLSCIWMVFWVILVQDSPKKQPYISSEERELITSQLGQSDGPVTKKPPVPWRSVFTSLPFYAILIAHTCSNWGWYMLLIETPEYLQKVVRIGLTEISMYTSLAFFTLWLFSLGLSKTLDTLRAKGKITTTFARKTGTLFASVVPGICLLGLCFIGCNTKGAIALTIIGITAVGGMFCGFLSNHIDIAPNYAGTLMAMTNTVATVPGIIVPIIVGILTNNVPDEKLSGPWQTIFSVTIVLYVIEILVYTIFGSGEEQSWNKKAVVKGDFEGNEQTEATPLNVRSEK